MNPTRQMLAGEPALCPVCNAAFWIAATAGRNILCGPNQNSTRMTHIHRTG